MTNFNADELHRQYQEVRAQHPDALVLIRWDENTYAALETDAAALAAHGGSLDFVAVAGKPVVRACIPASALDDTLITCGGHVVVCTPGESGPSIQRDTASEGVLAEGAAEEPGGESENVVEASDDEEETDPVVEPAPESLALAAAEAEKPAPRPEPLQIKTADDPYEWDKCNITLALTFLPEDGQPGGRIVAIAVHNHRDAPLVGSCRLDELGPLPRPISLLLEELRAQLPARAMAKAQKDSAKAEEERKRQERLSTSRKKTTAAAPAKPAAPQPVEVPQALQQDLFTM